MLFSPARAFVSGKGRKTGDELLHEIHAELPEVHVKFNPHAKQLQDRQAAEMVNRIERVCARIAEYESKRQ
jgi:hypothetical protein